ncbi:hypothetical protein PCE1_003052 [Barthelona sp. PCE]
MSENESLIRALGNFLPVPLTDHIISLFLHLANKKGCTVDGTPKRLNRLIKGMIKRLERNDITKFKYESVFLACESANPSRAIKGLPTSLFLTVASLDDRIINATDDYFNFSVHVLVPLSRADWVFPEPGTHFIATNYSVVKGVIYVKDVDFRPI